MNNMVLHLMLIGHLLGDFYFQSPKMAAQKDDRWGILLKHCIVYSLCVFIALFPFFSHNMLILFMSLSILHFLIDFCKSLYSRAIKNKKFVFKNLKWSNSMQTKIFIIDQIAHLLCIIGIFLLFKLSGAYLQIGDMIEKAISSMELDLSLLTSWIAGLLLIGRPASVAIRIILNPFKPEDEMSENESGIVNAGSWIGIFERFIMLVFLSLNQFSAIGFVLTAKSIARYKRITDDPKFSEYYLLGTLLSTIFALCTRFLLF